MTDADNDLRERGGGNDVKGKMNELGGKVQKGAGDLTGNEGMKNEGRKNEIKGKAQQGLGDVERGAGNALDKVDGDNI
jgi:uncharacterized protein YjbJ (UPF0337 family)